MVKIIQQIVQQVVVEQEDIEIHLVQKLQVEEELQKQN